MKTEGWCPYRFLKFDKVKFWSNRGKVSHLPYRFSKNDKAWYNITNMEKSLYTIQDASTMLGISGQVLRRLCNSGLIPNVRRNKRGFRVLEDWQIDYARTILGLRQAGLSQAELKQYTRLFRQGKATLAERKAMLETQKRQLWQELEDRQQGIDFLERQTELIDQELTKGQEQTAGQVLPEEQN